MKSKGFLRFWMFVGLLILLAVIRYPVLLTGQVTIAYMGHERRVSFLILIVIWLTGYFLLQLMLWLIGRLVGWPSYLKNWYRVRQQNLAREQWYRQLMNELWLQEDKIGDTRIKLPQLSVIQERFWSAIQWVMIIKYAVSTGDYHRVFVAISELVKCDDWWGRIWYWKVRAAMRLSGMKSVDIGSDSDTMCSNDACCFTFQESELVALAPEMQLKLIEYFEITHCLWGLDLLLKKASWRDLSKQYEDCRVRRWRLYLDLHSNEDTEYRSCVKRWKELPRDLRYKTVLANWWIDNLIGFGVLDEAKDYLVKTLEHGLSVTLLQCYLQMALDDSEQLTWLERVEQWIDRCHGWTGGQSDCDWQSNVRYELLVCAGQLCLALQLWGKAVDYWQEAQRVAGDLWRYLYASQMLIKVTEQHNGMSTAYELYLPLMTEVTTKYYASLSMVKRN